MEEERRVLQRVRSARVRAAEAVAEVVVVPLLQVVEVSLLLAAVPIRMHRLRSEDGRLLDHSTLRMRTARIAPSSCYKD